MVIHRSGQNCVALYIDGAEMASYGWEEVEEEQARLLAEDALIGLGLRPRDLLEIEAFAGYDGVMIFAQILSADSAETVFYSFDNADFLLEMACSAKFRKPVPSALYVYEDRYILRVTGMGVLLAQWLIHLSEYGHRLPHPEEFEFFLAEHGSVLIKNNALQLLLKSKTVK